MRRLKCLILMIFAAYAVSAQTPTPEYRADSRLYEILGQKRVEELQKQNPAQLAIEHYNLVSFCYLAGKLTEEEGTYKMQPELKLFVKPGKSCDYQRILTDGCINRYDYTLAQDPYFLNVYPLGDTGSYIIVYSKRMFDENLHAFLQYYHFEMP